VSDNFQKLIALAVLAAIVVIGVVLTSGDDTDFTRNAAFAKGGDATSFAKAGDVGSLAKGGDATSFAKAGDETLDLLKSINCQLERLIDTHRIPEASTSGTSCDVEEIEGIVDLMSETCLGLDPASWSSYAASVTGSRCVRDYLVGFPLELARAVVLAHGKFGFFHRWNFDLGERAAYGPSSLDEVTTEEACEPILYGYNPPPRMAIAVDTSDGVVLPAVNEFYDGNRNTGYMQLIGHFYIFGDADVLDGATVSGVIEDMHWPTYLEFRGYCE
jgi:hypothetical protein